MPPVFAAYSTLEHPSNLMLITCLDTVYIINLFFTYSPSYPRPYVPPRSYLGLVALDYLKPLRICLDNMLPSPF